MREAIKPGLAGERKAHLESEGTTVLKTYVLFAVSWCYLLLFVVLSAICYQLLLLAAISSF
jgi:hypothetical protein